MEIEKACRLEICKIKSLPGIRDESRTLKVKDFDKRRRGNLPHGHDGTEDDMR